MANKNTTALRDEMARMGLFSGASEDTLATYAASEEAFFPHGPRNGEENYMTRAAATPPEFDYAMAQFYLDAVRMSGYVRKNYGEIAHVRVTRPDVWWLMSGGTGAYSEPEVRVIALPEDGFGLRRETVLHEFAHVLMYDTNPLAWKVADGHGIEFAKINADLIDYFMPEKARTFRERLHFYGMEVGENVQSHNNSEILRRLHSESGLSESGTARIRGGGYAYEAPRWNPHRGNPFYVIESMPESSRIESVYIPHKITVRESAPGDWIADSGK